MITAYDTTGTGLWQVYSFIKNTPLCKTSSPRNRSMFGLNDIPINSINIYIKELLNAGLIEHYKYCRNGIYYSNSKQYIIIYPSKTPEEVKKIVNARRMSLKYEIESAKIKARPHIARRLHVDWTNVAQQMM